MKTYLMPLGNRILVEPLPLELEEKTESGVIVPKNQTTNIVRGKILQVSGFVIEPALKVNRTVWYNRGCTSVITMVGKDYHLLDVPNILGYECVDVNDK